LVEGRVARGVNAVDDELAAVEVAGLEPVGARLEGQTESAGAIEHVEEVVAGVK
jgi:hypothetical protein